MVVVDIIAGVVASMRKTYTVTAVQSVTGGYRLSVSGFPTWSKGKYVLVDSTEYLCTDVTDTTITISSKAPTMLAFHVTPTAPIFLHGHPRDVVDQLKDYLKAPGTTSEKRYPVIALFEPFKESVDTENYTSVELNVVICNTTLPEYHSPQRYDYNFRTVLLPLKDAFIEALKVYHKALSYKKNISYVSINHTYWGKQGLYGSDGNIFNDFIDAVELENLNLLLTSENCISNGKFVK